MATQDVASPINGPTTIETSTLEEESDNRTLEVKYWDTYFAETTKPTEWLLSWSTAHPFFAPYLTKDPLRLTLAIGTGNSDFPSALQEAGYCPRLIASDFSSTVIDAMNSTQTSSGTQLTYEVQDARNMTYKDEEADLIIDKSLFDCMFWAENRQASIAPMINEIHRVLKAQGTALFMTQRTPLEVNEYFNLVSWDSIEFIPIAAKTNEDGDVVPGCPACLEDVFDDYFDQTVFYELVFIYICVKTSAPSTSKSTTAPVEIVPCRNMERYASIPPTNTTFKKRVRSYDEDEDDEDDDEEEEEEEDGTKNKKRRRLNREADAEQDDDDDDDDDTDDEITKCPAMVAFANDVPKLVQWGQSFDLENTLRNNSGFVIIDNFLPVEAAKEVRALLLNTDREVWKLNADDGDNDDTPHQFLSCSSHPDPGFSSVTRAIWSLMTDRLPNFSAARYNASDHIALHDDSLVIPAQVGASVSPEGEGEGDCLYRDIAVVLYMVDDEWSEEKDGGVLLDWGPTNQKFEAPKRICPKFNRLVCFQVPRFHEVTQVEDRNSGTEEDKEERPRLSVFGWFLTEKKLY